MEKSESVKELAAALAKAQAKIEGAIKDKTNPHFRSQYADLSSVVDAIRAPLAAAGLSYTQVMHDGERAARVETLILHESGEWLSCGIISVPVVKEDAQGFGSALTYARRYGLSAAFGVAPADDDGNAAAAAKPSAKILSGPIPANYGAKDNVSPEERARVDKIAGQCLDWLNADPPSVADAVAVADEAEMTVEEVMYFWTKFDSKQRTAMKAEQKARRERMLKREEATQA